MDLPHRLYRDKEVDRLYRDLLAAQTGLGTDNFAAPTDIAPDDANAEGTADTAARSDHKHGITAAAAGAATPGDSAAEGTASSFARSDHKHSLAGFGSSAGTFCQGNDARLSDARTPTSHHTTHESGGSDAIKLDDLAAPDDNTDLNVSTSKHGLTPKLPNDSTQFLNGTGGYTTPSGIGGIGTWFPDAPPASPESTNDEFTAGSLDGKWGTWDPASAQTRTMDTTRKMFNLTMTGNGGIRYGGIYQAVPGSEFAIYAKIAAIAASGTNGFGMGIFVSDDIVTNPTTADFRTCEQGHSSSALNTQTRTWSAYNGSSSSVSSRAILCPYVRIRCNGTTCASDISVDGVGWHQLASVTLGFTPTHFGILLGAQDNTITVAALYDFFRCFSGAGTSGVNATSIGRYV